MKRVTVLFVINSVTRGKKIIYKIPKALNVPTQDSFNRMQEGTAIKPDTAEVLIENFMENTKIIGCVEPTFQEYSADFLADLFSPKQSTGQQCTVFVVEDLKFISHPVFIKQEEKKQDQSKSNVTAEEESGMTRLYSFNTILVFKEKDEVIQNLKELLYFFAKSLEFEEKRNNFVSKEVSKILNLDHEFRTNVKNMLKDIKKEERLGDQTREHLINKITVLANDCIKKVQLFDLLEELHRSISNLSQMKFKIDKLLLRTFNLYPINNGETKIGDIKPYQTVLIMKKKCNEQLEYDSSPRFKRFINSHNPKNSLIEMSVELDLTLEEVMLYAAHLVSWQYGQIINVISKESIYVINQNLNSEYFSEELSKKFRNKFKNDLVQILHTFSTPMPLYKLKDKIKMDTNMIFLLITWLLKHSYIAEYNYYIYLTVSPEEFRARVKEMKDSQDEKIRKSGEVCERLLRHCLTKTSVVQIAFEEDIPRERIFKLLFQEKSLFGYYYAQ